MMDGFLLGIDIGGTKVAMATAALADGGVVRTARFPSSEDDSAHDLLRRIVAAAHDLVEQTSIEANAPLAAIGVVCPGIVHDDGVRLAPNNPGWDELRVRDIFDAAFPGLPVGIMNDVKAAALAEAARGALAGVGWGIFLNLGTGIAAAYVLNGEVIDGAHGAAGEIGYQLPGAARRPAYADGHAPLEEVVSGKALSDLASKVVGRHVGTAEAFTLAEHDSALRVALDEALDLLAVHVANLATALDPQRIVIAGGLAHQSDAFLPRLSAAVERVVPFPPEITLAGVPDDAGVAGALELAARARRSPHTTSPMR
jgi:glucokinase